jgi:hypothetical protein
MKSRRKRRPAQRLKRLRLATPVSPKNFAEGEGGGRGE